MESYFFKYEEGAPTAKVKTDHRYQPNTYVIPQPVREEAYDIPTLQERFDKVKLQNTILGGPELEAELILTDTQEEDLNTIQRILTTDTKPKFEASKTYPAEKC